MFVCTFRSSKLKWIVIILLCLLAAGAFWWFSSASKSAARNSTVELHAANASERLAFISQFGWQVEEDPVQVTEILIPTEFDEAFEKYNAVQQAQELDLSPYGGKRVKRWTYAVTNYPGYEGRADVIELSLLILDGVVIGGDVSSTETPGFVHGLDFPQPDVPTTEYTTHT